MKVLVTGATGFIGHFLVNAALAEGWDVWAGVRATSNKQRLDALGIRYFPFDFAQRDHLTKDLRSFAAEHGGFDVVIHNAGVTKSVLKDDFYKGNAHFTQYFGEALLKTQPGLRKFVYMSSMAATGPGDPSRFEPITEQREPKPITIYGKSKRLGEILLHEIEGLPYVVLRPTAVYGEYNDKFLGALRKMLAIGVDIRLGSPDQQGTYMYAGDLAAVCINACKADAEREVYNLSDGLSYTQSHFYDVVKRALNVSTVSIRIPRPLIVGFGHLNARVMALQGKTPYLSADKMRELTARNWIVDIAKAQKELDFHPRYDIESGVQRSFANWK